jgi:hypothetical protein
MFPRPQQQFLPHFYVFFNADPDPAFHFNVDLDPDFLFSADSDRILLLIKVMQIGDY